MDVGKAWLFLPNPELPFPPKMWLKSDFCGIILLLPKIHFKSIWQEISAALPDLPWAPNPITASMEKKHNLGSKINSQQKKKNTSPAIPEWNKRRKTQNARLRNSTEIWFPCGPACAAVGFQDSFNPCFWLGGSWWNILKLGSEGWALCGDEMFTSAELLEWIIVFMVWGVWD